MLGIASAVGVDVIAHRHRVVANADVVLKDNLLGLVKPVARAPVVDGIALHHTVPRCLPIIVHPPADAWRIDTRAVTCGWWQQNV